MTGESIPLSLFLFINAQDSRVSLESLSSFTAHAAASEYQCKSRSAHRPRAARADKFTVYSLRFPVSALSAVTLIRLKLRHQAKLVQIQSVQTVNTSLLLLVIAFTGQNIVIQHGVSKAELVFIAHAAQTI